MVLGNYFTSILYNFFIVFKILKCSSVMEPYVVGGDYASIVQFPHSVFLSIYCGEDDELWVCGSSILNQAVLLTAAHCINSCQYRKRWNIDAHAGHENLNKVRVLRKADKMLMHNEYDEVTVANDIALVFLGNDLPLGRNIKRVIISRQYPSARDALVAGWGIVDDDTKEETMKLKSVPQKLRPRNTCSLIGHLEPGMMCAGSTYSWDSRPSEGDSGSALVTPKFEQIGIVSYRVTRYPALLVYTNVTYYYPWIKDKAKLLYCN